MAAVRVVAFGMGAFGMVAIGMGAFGVGAIAVCRSGRLGRAAGDALFRRAGDSFCGRVVRAVLNCDRSTHAELL